MITIKFNRMASEEDPQRVDVWIEDDTDSEAFGFIGEVSLSAEEFNKLYGVSRGDTDIDMEVND